MAARRDAAQSSHDVDESLWTSPVEEQPSDTPQPRVSSKPLQPSTKTDTDSKAAREIRLRQELEDVRKVNEAIEGVLQNLEKAKSNMTSVNQTVGSASSLLNIWTRILSQTEHSQRLILDPSWQGASQDIADMEEEVTSQRQAAEQRELEEQERRAAAAKKAEEEDRRRADVAATKPKPAIRGRSVAGRGSSATRSASTGAGTTNTSTINTSRGTTSRRTTSGLGRGTRITRGRG